MCGFSGILQECNYYLAAVVIRVNDALTHRGHDDRGIWGDETAGLALGHRRLAIVDLSDAGHQPMHSSCGRYVVVFNGEIYNHSELNQKLNSERLSSLLWRGHSDTEVLLVGRAGWGLGKTLPALVGMFAFVLWDKHEHMSEPTDLLESQLRSSIGQQVLADVPLGAFLGGGVDSGTVVALMQAKSAQPIRTFTIGFDEGGYDDAVHAKAVSRHMGTQQTELYLGPEDVLTVIPRLRNMYCDPFSGSSKIPTFLVSHLVSQQLKVVLGGDGGDEFFDGYNRYLSAKNVWSKLQQLPPLARQVSARLLRSLLPPAWDSLFRIVKALLPKRFYISTSGDKVYKLANFLTIADGHEFYLPMNSHSSGPANLVIGGEEPKTIFTDSSRWPKTHSFELWMMAMNAQTYLSDDIMVKLDRAAMAASVEGSVPLLDHRIVELACRMPLGLKVRNGQGKWLLREVLYRYVPKEFIERSKQGFGIPLGARLLGPFREWAESLLSEMRLRQEGYFRPEPIRHMWQEHLQGRGSWQSRLWTILMFQAWLGEQA